MVPFSRGTHSKMQSLATLLKSGFTPTLKDFNDFLNYLSGSRRFKTVILIFTQLSSNRIHADSVTHTVFTNALLKEHQYDEAVDFLKTLMGRSDRFDNIRILDSLIQGLCTYSRNPEKGLSLLKDFLESDTFFPSSRTFSLLIYSFSSQGKMDRVVELLNLMYNDKLKYPFDNYVYSSVIAGYVRIGEPELAVEFYENAVKSGSLKPNTVTCTAVLSAYCKLRNVDMISDLVSWMEKCELVLDAVFYSNWMYGCMKEGLIEEAFKKVRAMVDRKIEFDTVGYTILIDHFSKNGNVEKAVGFLYKMERVGVPPNLITYSAIILGFCRKGKLEEAFAFFRMLKNIKMEVDEFTYAIVIDGVCRKGDFELAFQLLDEMGKAGINPGIVTYNTIINGLCKAGRACEADDFSKSIDGDKFTYSILLHGYIQERSTSGILEIRRRLEEAGIRLDVVICNLLIKALLMLGLFEDAIAIYNGLPKIDVPANSATFFTLINGFCKAGRMNEALEIFDEFRKMSISSAACYKCIILGLCQKGMVNMAINVFSEYIWKGLPLDRKIYIQLVGTILDKKGPEGILNAIYTMEHLELQALHVICSEAISYLCEMGFTGTSCSILSFMKRKGLASTGMCYYSILTALLIKGEKLQSQLLLTSFIKIYGIFGPETVDILLHCLCLINVKKALTFISVMNERKWNVTIPVAVFETLKDAGRVLDAYELLVGAELNLPPMNVIDYSIIIDALCKGRYIDKALEVCSSALRRGITLNTVTYNSVINGLCHQGCLVEGFRLFDSLEKLNVFPSEITYGTLVDALVREGLLVDAQMLFDKMFVKELRPNIHIYNSLINGYCKSSQLEDAVKLFQELERRNLEPDGFTIAALINGYCHKGDMEGALLLFLEFKNKGLLPDFLGFMYLIRGLCPKGRLEEARSVLREMLQTKSVIDLLGRVDTEVESDSVEDLLVFLCEQGRIQEAVTLLDEVASMFFSSRRKSSDSVFHPHDIEVNTDLQPSTNEKTAFHLSSDVDEFEIVVKRKLGESEEGKERLLQDFDSFYAILHSHCSKGELDNANKLTKLIVERGAVM